jgi:hypothetical protein
MEFSLKYTATVAVYKIMRKLILSLTALASLTMASATAFADLGDTYSQSCAKYGGKGSVDKAHHCIVWHQHHQYVVETFVKNECVVMRLVPEKGFGYTVDLVENMLPFECGSQQAWVSNGGAEGDYVAQWATRDGLVLAAYYQNGYAQFAYAWFLKSKGFLEAPTDYGSAPVEDTPGDGEQKTNA